jgi:4-amino-4-deoxychorismate lyase
LSPVEVGRADAVFLCNAVRGILPVRRIGLHEWSGHQATSLLRRQLAEAQPAFAFKEY